MESQRRARPFRAGPRGSAPAPRLRAPARPRRPGPAAPRTLRSRRARRAASPARLRARTRQARAPGAAGACKRAARTPRPRAARALAGQRACCPYRAIVGGSLRAVLLALSTSHKLGLGLTGAVFIAFALASSFILPRYRPDYPGRALRWFVLACLVLFAGMLVAVEVFGPGAAEGGAEEETAGPPPAPTPR